MYKKLGKLNYVTETPFVENKDMFAICESMATRRCVVYFVLLIGFGCFAEEDWHFSGCQSNLII